MSFLLISRCEYESVDLVTLTGVFLNSVDKFNEDGENQVSLINKANMKPLLEDNRDSHPATCPEP